MCASPNDSSWSGVSNVSFCRLCTCSPPRQPLSLFSDFCSRTLRTKFNLVSKPETTVLKSLMRGYGIPETAPHPRIWAGYVNQHHSCIWGLFHHGDLSPWLQETSHNHDVSGDATDNKLWRQLHFRTCTKSWQLWEPCTAAVARPLVWGFSMAYLAVF